MATAAEWTAAVGTIGAVVVALFPQTRRAVWRPSIELEGDRSPFSVHDRAHGRYVRHAYLRLQVSAKHWRPPAEDLQVTLLHSEDGPALLNKQEELAQHEFRMPLRWAFSHDPAVNLNAGAVRYVDLAEVREDQPQWAKLAPVKGPGEGYWLRGREKPYVLTVEVSAATMNATRWTVTILHRGDWSGQDEDITRAFSVMAQKARGGRRIARAPH
jgi:hypothetical protein